MAAKSVLKKAKLTGKSREAHELLKDKEEPLRKIIEHSSNLFYKHTIDNKLTYISPQTHTFFDCEPEDLLHQYASLFTENPINEIGKKNTQKAIETGEVQPPFELELIGKKGRKIWVEVHETPIIENGKVTGIVGALVDITNWKKTYDKLIFSEEKFRKLFSEAPDGILLINAKGIIVDCNQAYCNLLECKKDEIINKHIFASICKKDMSLWEEKFQSLSKTGKSIEEICLVTKKKQTIDVRRSASALYNEGGEFAGAIVHTHNITEHKRLEAQLRHSQKMEAIGLMASGIAHNFNNILQSIVGYIDFAKEGLTETEQRYKDIEQINQLVKRATMLTKGLLAVGREQFMKKNDVDLNDIILPIVDLTNRVTYNNIEVRFNPQENLPTVNADGLQIDQVIMNIFINSIDAMPDGGLIDIITERKNINNDFCYKNAWAKPGQYICISISDTGHGMDADTKRRIFEPYFTTKGVEKGTGLGLSTAFGIISQHNGLFNVISEVNKGTTFEVYLPLITNQIK
ncbi:MAG: PAS domain S-box protein [Bacteroidetes bacterium]|nr:PAS domain S-box protein [Bacteroidota bacterium]MBL6943878.1 PAS domain S-box protein [Bacteroidales bacterium]